METAALDEQTASRARAPFSREDGVLRRSREILGGSRAVGALPATRMDLHKAMQAGRFRYAAVLDALLTRLPELDDEDIAGVLGVSSRTLKRNRAEATPDKAMPADLASKAWLLAETTARAEAVFGGIRQAGAWMTRPAVGLDGHRPIDMLRTLQGAELVHEFLTRLEYGVYS